MNRREVVYRTTFEKIVAFSLSLLLFFVSQILLGASMRTLLDVLPRIENLYGSINPRSSCERDENAVSIMERGVTTTTSAIVMMDKMLDQ